MNNVARPDVRILVASEGVHDAELVCDILHQEFDSIWSSTDPNQAVADFESARPTVLILAFKVIENAELFYLKLFRNSAVTQALPHRAIILCYAENARQAYDLCRHRHFDDYVVFWSLHNDPNRLPMAVRHAHELTCSAAGPTAGEMAPLVRRIAELETLLDAQIKTGSIGIEAANRMVEQSSEEIDLAFSHFSRLIEKGLRGAVEVKDAVHLQHEIERLQSGEIGRRIRETKNAIQTVRQWAADLKDVLAPHMESMRTLKEMTAHIRPMILLVDDDDFQCKLIAGQLRGVNLELTQSASWKEAFAMLRTHRPDLILMDVQIPEMDGIEMTRRIKGIKEYADIPIIMITGKADKNTVTKSRSAGATDFIAKPIVGKILKQKIALHLKINTSLDDDE